MGVHSTFAGAVSGASDASIEAMAIGASTGGPQALFDLFDNIGSALEVPVFVTQHLPASFTPVLVERLGRIAQCPCVEARDGEVVAPGRIYFAPGERHMLIEGGRKAAVIRLSDAPRENYCRPAIDPMFRSAARTYGSALLAIVLSGMGEDGLAGAREVAAHGGSVIVQDEASSTVWEMPGAVADAGLASAVLSLAHIRHGILGAAAHPP